MFPPYEDKEEWRKITREILIITAGTLASALIMHFLAKSVSKLRTP